MAHPIDPSEPNWTREEQAAREEYLRKVLEALVRAGRSRREAMRMMKARPQLIRNGFGVDPRDIAGLILRGS